MTDGWKAGLRGRRMLVTGAGGFIGRRLVAALAAAGADVTAVGRSRLPPVLSGLPVRFQRADLADQAAMLQAVAGQEVVFNLAYDVRATAGANLAAFGTLVGAAEKAGAGRIVHLSSIVAYDGWPDGALTETSPMGRPGGGPYRQAKVATEARLMAGALPAAILQPTIVWGPGSALWTDLFAEALLRGAVLLPDPEGLCQGVFVEDVVQACLRAAVLPDLGRERFIVNGPEPFAWSTLIEGYRGILGAGEVRRIPAEALRPADVPEPDAARGPSAAARISAVGRRLIGHDRFEALVRRLRRRAGGTEMRPDAHLFALMTARGACPPDHARTRLGYAPAFGLSEGLEATRAYLAALAKT